MLDDVSCLHRIWQGRRARWVQWVWAGFYSSSQMFSSTFPAALAMILSVDVYLSLCVFVERRQADAHVLPQQCDLSSGHDALQLGQRLLLEERVREGSKMPQSGGCSDTVGLNSGLLLPFRPGLIVFIPGRESHWNHRKKWDNVARCCDFV